MRDIAITFNSRHPSVAIIVLGGTLDDLGLMRIANTFVTGPADPSELGALCKAHAVGALFVCAARPLFGHPLQSFGQASALPLACFDWSKGRHAPRCGDDLLLDPQAPGEAVAAALARWIGLH